MRPQRKLFPIIRNYDHAQVIYKDRESNNQLEWI